MAAAVSPEDDGDDRSLAGERLEAQLEQPLAEVAGVAREGVVTRSGCASRYSTLASALAATVGGSALEKSCGRARWVR